jgi:hypothetical protein
VRYIGSVQSTGVILDGQRYNLQFQTEYNITHLFQVMILLLLELKFIVK